LSRLYPVLCPPYSVLWTLTHADSRIFGVTTLDVVRASRFLGEIKDADPKDINVTVVGGHSGVTIVPLLSQTKLGKDVKGEEYKALVKRIQFGGDGA
jgi:malate dehydrogenase